MKKIICVCLAAAMVLGVLTGCQQTPEAPIVNQKNIDVFIEKAQSSESADNSPLWEQTGAPERVEYNEMALGGRLNVQVDADVVFPDANAMPVLRVKAVDFSEDLSIALFNKLCKDDVLMDTSKRLTKSEIEREILENEQLKKSDDYIDDPQAQAMFDEMNETLRKQYESAPETQAPMQVDGSFYSIPVIDPRNNIVSSYMGIEGTNDDKYFIIRNSNGLEKPIIYDYEGGGWAGLAAGSLATLYYDVFAYMQTGRWKCLPSVLVEDESVVPEEAHGRLNCTPAEARAMAEEVLEGTGMGVYRIYLDCDYDAYNPELETRTVETSNYGYTLECLRMINGVPCAADSGVSTGDMHDRYAPSWPYEQCTIFITNDGIQSILWSSPIEITDTVMEQSNLMPFGDVLDIFKKMGPVVYTPNDMNNNIPYGDEEVAEYGMTVNEIRLELRRVREQNSVKDGLLIPAWSFYGNTWYSTKDGSEVETPISPLNSCLLTINAVDGSIIDLLKGY